MKSLKSWEVAEITESEVKLQVDGQHFFSIFILDTAMMRVLIQKKQTLVNDRTWSIVPCNDVPLSGRDRRSLEGFSCPSFEFEDHGDTVNIMTSQLKVTISTPLALTWYYKVEDAKDWVEIASDRKTSAYQLGVGAHTEIAHYLMRFPKEKYYGLGEKAGNLERSGRRYEMRNLDAMGYDAQHTDPLYKHIPFTITSSAQISYGIFYDNLTTSVFDLGNELDNYHAYYRKYEAEAGDLDYYFFVGPSILQTTQKITTLTGQNCFLPKWSLGYSGSTMSYTDAPNAQERLLEFIELCKIYDIPCDSFQLSSGYTSIENKRYVFHWNIDKFPNILEFTQTYVDAGIRLVANIKPCLLHDHPQYQNLKNLGCFVKDSETDGPEISVFWDDEGSHIDFTNPTAYQWWKDNVTTQLLEKGIHSTWNDNNEYEIWDRDAVCNGFGRVITIQHMRPVMPILMMRASREAQVAFQPDKRPYLISRSGSLGMQRYAQTWSGDNRTSWSNLKFNIKMGLGMSLSGLYNIGHDVGGFSGNKPDAELFARWVQNGIMHPRFTIHSWNDDQTVNEPWMYPRVTPIIQSAMKLRYQLLPYFYHHLWRAYDDNEPFLRPTFLDYETDPKNFEENDDFFIGSALLVASVVNEGEMVRDVYLPKAPFGWYDFYTHNWHHSGQTISVDAPLEKLPLLVKAGEIIPMAKRIAYVNAQQDDERTWLIFPAIGKGQSNGYFYDDDGESSEEFSKSCYLKLFWTLESNAERIDLTIHAEGNYQTAYKSINCCITQHETRPLYINGKLVSTFVLA